mmetsp:Transcript_36738/g.79532  ORF Transcript_36738/g.79532 Transcript_36738/m.79532 type:complete len:492 (-) Transcript_36738:583-2058(-)
MHLLVEEVLAKGGHERDLVVGHLGGQNHGRVVTQARLELLRGRGKGLGVHPIHGLHDRREMSAADGDCLARQGARLGDRELFLELRDRALRRLEVAHQRGHPRNDFFPLDLELGRKALHNVVRGTKIVHHLVPSHSLNPSDAGGNPGFGDNPEAPNLLRVSHVGAPTQLHGNALARIRGNIDHSHHVVVLLSKHGRRTLGLGLVDGHLPRRDRISIGDPLIYEALHFPKLLLCHRFGVIEVKSEDVVLHKRPSLAHVVPEHTLERGLEEVGRRVVRVAPAPVLLIHRTRDRVPDGNFPSDDGAFMQAQRSPRRHLHISDADRGSSRGGNERALVPHLASGLGVEWRPVQHHRHLVPLACDAGLTLVLPQNREHLRLAAEPTVASEDGRGALLGQFALKVVEGHVDRVLGGPRERPCRLHGRLEAIHVDTDPLVGSHLLCDLHRETKGVVQHEGVSAAHLRVLRGGGGRLVHQIRQNRLASVQGLDKALLFP